MILSVSEIAGILQLRDESLMQLKNGVTYSAGGFGRAGLAVAEK